MAIDNVRTIVENCYNEGRFSFTSFRKAAAIASTSETVVDFSMSPGNPRPNFYTGDALTTTAFNGNYGIYTGGNVSPQTKVLRHISALTVNSGLVPLKMYAIDYLMFYPLIDMDSTDEQVLENTITLPRYTDGKGVKAFLVATNPYVGGASFDIKYTNEYGQTDRHTGNIISNTSTYIGTIVHSGVTASLSGTFIKTYMGEGIRSVESITFNAPNGGLAALVLCRPITSFFIREVTTPSEWDFLLYKNELPIIQDNAYLNFIGQVSGSAAGTVVIGSLETIWN